MHVGSLIGLLLLSLARATEFQNIPVIDLSNPEDIVVASLRSACVNVGFFYVSNHGLVFDELFRSSANFFANATDEEKDSMRMWRAGKAWRGYFSVGGVLFLIFSGEELTSGKPDQKEGIYFGSEDSPDDPRPMHGPNLWPHSDGGALRAAVAGHMAACRALGARLARLLSLALAQPPDFFAESLGLAEPTQLFRIFHYPPLPPSNPSQLWSVGEHTDYGFLTLLLQDSTGGLEGPFTLPRLISVRNRQGQWVPAPPLPGTLVINLGDMLEKLTNGHFRSTPHRVRNPSDHGRFSFPYFYDPGWEAPIRSLPMECQSTSYQRWDGVEIEALNIGAYSEYLLAKVGKVFPTLQDGIRNY